MECGLCQNQVDESNTRVVSGLSVCEACLDSKDLPARLRDNGLHLSYAFLTKEGMVHPNEDFVFDYLVHQLTGLGISPHFAPIDAALVHEGFKAKVTKIFTREIQVGDPKFDDKVWIRTDTPDETGAFLRLSGVQSTILRLMDMQSEINIHGSKLYVITHGTAPVDVRQFVLQTGILLRHLTEFARP